MNPLSIYFILLSFVSKSNSKNSNISSKVGVVKLTEQGKPQPSKKIKC